MIYYGIPPAEPSGIFMVRWSADGNSAPHPLLPIGPTVLHGFGWGTLPPGTPAAIVQLHAQRCSNLALAMVTHLLGDESKARPVYQRVKHRTLVGWPWDQPFAITDDVLMASVLDVKDNDPEIERAIAEANRARPPIVSDGGISQLGVKIVWEKDSMVGRAQGRDDAEDNED